MYKDQIACVGADAYDADDADDDVADDDVADFDPDFEDQKLSHSV